MIRVLLVDDQELVRAGLRGILRGRFGFEIVAECGDGSDALTAVRQHRPDIVLMDVRMPIMGGVAATAQLRAEEPAVAVLALTTFDDDHAVAGMLRAGASGFVLKGAPVDELQRAVRVVADGGAWLDPAVTRRVLDVYRAAPAGQEEAAGALLASLTDREREVLTLIAKGQTNSEIAQALYVGEGTVKTHINHLFSKLNLRDRAAAVIFAYRHNLVDG
ncbi:MAG: DNA-binding response regulator [Acidimicrobiia bacterium]|nr:DNA-binding response regulator [Acidimicrobiia bacterium]